jgi:hypothetical protein
MKSSAYTHKNCISNTKRATGKVTANGLINAFNKRIDVLCKVLSAVGQR